MKIKVLLVCFLLFIVVDAIRNRHTHKSKAKIKQLFELIKSNLPSPSMPFDSNPPFFSFQAPAVQQSSGSVTNAPAGGQASGSSSGNPKTGGSQAPGASPGQANPPAPNQAGGASPGPASPAVPVNPTLTAAPQRPSASESSTNPNVISGSVEGTITPGTAGNVFLPPGIYGGTTDTSKQSVNPIKEGWLKISSIILVNNKRYPNIPLGGGNFAKVNLIEPDPGSSAGPANPSQFDYFRKNEKFTKGGAIPSIDSFYFRISGTNLYYTERKEDMVVLGAISVRNIESSSNSPIGGFCFVVKNREDDEWDLCANDKEDKKAWMCAIMSTLGQNCEIYPSPLVFEEKKILKQPVMIIPLPSPYCNENWNYMMYGSDWNCKCAEGFLQSPLDLDPKCINLLNQTSAFSFPEVDPQKVGMYYEENMLKLKCSGEAKDCKDFSFGGLIDLNYSTYIAQEIRFHTPGEHRIKGEVFDMEVQVIYFPRTDADYAKKAVLSFLIKMTPGATNMFFDKIDLLNLPHMFKKKEAFKTNLNPDLENLSLGDIFRIDDEDPGTTGYFNYFMYEGSLTSPPCDERVLWYVVEEPVKISYTIVEMVKQVLEVPKLSQTMPDGGSKYVADFVRSPNPDGNSRQVQKINGRSIYFFDVEKYKCLPAETAKPPRKPKGHFERIEKKVKSYFWVPGKEPSGVPEAFVVPAFEALGQKPPEPGNQGSAIENLPGQSMLYYVNSPYYRQFLTYSGIKKQSKGAGGNDGKVAVDRGMARPTSTGV